MVARLLIADDNDFVRGAVGELLRNQDCWEVCASVEDGGQAVLKAIELRLNIVMLDLTMPVMNGLQAAGKIGKVLPLVRTILYTIHDLPAFHLEAKKVGIRRIISKPATEALLGSTKELSTEQSRETAQSSAAADPNMLNPTRSDTIETLARRIAKP
jgi:DNA-binding NarL/FixJ family response regulator